MRSRRTRRLAACVAISSAICASSCTRVSKRDLAFDDPQWQIHREELRIGAAAPLAVTYRFRPSSAAPERVVAATAQTLATLAEWLGPLPSRELQIVDVPLGRRLADAPASVVAITSRWLSPPLEHALERALIAGVARMYWMRSGTSETPSAFVEGLTAYTAARAINADGLAETLDSRPRHVERFFGGTVPYTVRSLVLTRDRRDPRPIITRFPESMTSSFASAQAVAALHTFERHFGWPPLQQALAALFARGGGADAPALGDILSEQQGVDRRWFFAAAPQAWADFDYGVSSFTTGAHEDGDAGYRTRIRVQRFGASALASRSVQVATAFADGSHRTEWWDGRDEQVDLDYTSRSRAMRVSVDPEATLLLDRDRSNNQVVVEPSLPRYGQRLVAGWMNWLQDLMLSCTALV